MVLGHAQVQSHHLIALTGMLDGSGVTGFYAQAAAVAVFARRPVQRPCPNLDTALPIDVFDL